MTGTRLRWTAIIGALLVSTAVVGLPVWLIQPFAPQTPAGVAWSWQLRELAPRLTVAMWLFVAAGAVGLATQPSPSRARRSARLAGLVAAVGLATAAAWFARQNHFEWMFRPFPDPRFVAADAATDLPAEEPVIGIARGGAALAFPITRIGYHHIVNATLGDVPIVATY
jgi:hypothetical protein